MLKRFCSRELFRLRLAGGNIRLPAIDSTFRYINTLDLRPQLYDQLHFNRLAKLELGRRMGDAWLAWINDGQS